MVSHQVLSQPLKLGFLSHGVATLGTRPRSALRSNVAPHSGQRLSRSPVKLYSQSGQRRPLSVVVSVWLLSISAYRLRKYTRTRLFSKPVADNDAGGLPVCDWHVVHGPIIASMNPAMSPPFAVQSLLTSDIQT